MKRLNISKKKIFLGIGLLFVFYVLLVLWPVRNFVFPMLKGKTLLVFTNEAEARPCGGFASAYGVVSVFPPQFKLKNVYDLSGSSYRSSDYPLTLVSDRENFWDAGISSNLSVCAESFRQHYQFAREDKISHVLLIDFLTLKEMVNLWSTFRLDGQKINSEEFFAKISRKVADIDRHDEESLATRKSPLASLGKSIILKSFNPLIPPRITHILANSLQEGRIYSSIKSPLYVREANDFGFTEWNLGGGKSSRYLQKNIEISAREIAPSQWQWKVRFEASHLGGWDEPLSQTWKGLFIFDFPDFLGQESIEKEVVMEAGKNYEQGFIFDTKAPIPERIGLFTPRGQELQYRASFSALPQQNIISPSLEVRENTAFDFGKALHPRTDLSIEISPDRNLPFLTFHKVISKDSLGEELKEVFRDSNLIVEIHTSEDISLNSGFRAEIIDRDYEQKDITENPVYKKHILKEDKHSLLIGFIQNNKQLNERYYLKLSGLQDIWGNEIDTEAKRTIIDRAKKILD